MSSGETIRAALFDAGGVLVHPDWARIADILAEHGIFPERDRMYPAELAAMRALDDPEVVARTDDAGRLALFFRDAVARSGATLTDTALAAVLEVHRRENLWSRVPDDVLPALDRIRARGVRTAVVSNANGTVRRKLARLGLLDRFDLVVDSGEEGVEKPDPRIFQRALSRLGIEPVNTVHIGDLYHIDVIGARAAGISPVLLDRGGVQQDRPCARVGTLQEFMIF